MYSTCRDNVYIYTQRRQEDRAWVFVREAGRCDWSCAPKDDKFVKHICSHVLSLRESDAEILRDQAGSDVKAYMINGITGRMYLQVSGGIPTFDGW